MEFIAVFVYVWTGASAFLCEGVGSSMSSKLTSLGVSTCGDLQQLSICRLQREFGPRTGQTLFRFCRGLDDRPVRSEKERKSVSAEMNYNIRFTQVLKYTSYSNHCKSPCICHCPQSVDLSHKFPITSNTLLG